MERSTFELSNKTQEYLDVLFSEEEIANRELNKWTERIKIFKESLEAKKLRVDNLTSDIDMKKQTVSFLNEVSRFYESHSIRTEIENILETILSSLYAEEDHKYKFIKEYVKSQHEITIYKVDKDPEGFEFLIPISDTEGGCRDIVDLIIRILVLKQFSPDKRVMFLDEPIKDLDKDLRQGFFTFLMKLSKNFSIQMNMVTHETEYIELIDNKIKFKRLNGKTEVFNGN